MMTLKITLWVNGDNDINNNYNNDNDKKYNYHDNSNDNVRQVNKW